MLDTDTIEVLGARVHNLKNIDVSIPREKLINHRAFGSGKSSLAFDTIYAEGRYVETFLLMRDNFWWFRTS
jgi:excinuclease ABC subunit A